MKTVIVDYGAGNLQSVKNALDYLQYPAEISGKAVDIANAKRIIFPGVGQFGEAMQRLEEKKLILPIKQAITKGKPFLGICLGLQLLFEESEESPGVNGLSIFRGKAVRFTTKKVPQIGWNTVIPQKQSILQQDFFYFVNSYYVVPEDKSIVLATADYGGAFVCAVQQKNITAVQFHPEKSGDAGLAFLQRWLSC